MKAASKNDPQLVREIHHHRLFKHPHIAEFYEFIVTESKVWLVLEYCPNDDLYLYLVRHHKLSIEETKRLFSQICGAVAYTHSKNCAHRDLKLENILLDKHNNAKLSDFGFTREYTPPSLLETICGTTCYMAPEMLLSNKYSGEAVDVWSLGVICYTLLYGEMPFEEDSEIDTKRKVIDSEPTYPDPSIDGEVLQLMKQMLSKDPRKRPSVMEILKHPWLESESKTQIEILKQREPLLFSTKSEKRLLRTLRAAQFDTDSMMESVYYSKCDPLAGTWALALRREKKAEAKHSHHHRHHTRNSSSRQSASISRYSIGRRDSSNSKVSLLHRTSSRRSSGANSNHNTEPSAKRHSNISLHGSNSLKYKRQGSDCVERTVSNEYRRSSDSNNIRETTLTYIRPHSNPLSPLSTSPYTSAINKNETIKSKESGKPSSLESNNRKEQFTSQQPQNKEGYEVNSQKRMGNKNTFNRSSISLTSLSEINTAPNNIEHPQQIISNQTQLENDQLLSLHSETSAFGTDDQGIETTKSGLNNTDTYSNYGTVRASASWYATSTSPSKPVKKNKKFVAAMKNAWLKLVVPSSSRKKLNSKPSLASSLFSSVTGTTSGGTGTISDRSLTGKEGSLNNDADSLGSSKAQATKLDSRNSIHSQNTYNDGTLNKEHVNSNSSAGKINNTTYDTPKSNEVNQSDDWRDSNETNRSVANPVLISSSLNTSQDANGRSCQPIDVPKPPPHKYISSRASNTSTVTEKPGSGVKGDSNTPCENLLHPLMEGSHLKPGKYGSNYSSDSNSIDASFSSSLTNAHYSYYPSIYNSNSQRQRPISQFSQFSVQSQTSNTDRYSFSELSSVNAGFTHGSPKAHTGGITSSSTNPLPTSSSGQQYGSQSRRPRIDRRSTSSSFSSVGSYNTKKNSFSKTHAKTSSLSSLSLASTKSLRSVSSTGNIREQRRSSDSNVNRVGSISSTSTNQDGKRRNSNNYGTYYKNPSSSGSQSKALTAYTGTDGKKRSSSSLSRHNSSRYSHHQKYLSSASSSRNASRNPSRRASPDSVLSVYSTGSITSGGSAANSYARGNRTSTPVESNRDSHSYNYAYDLLRKHRGSNSSASGARRRSSSRASSISSLSSVSSRSSWRHQSRSRTSSIHIGSPSSSYYNGGKFKKGATGFDNRAATPRAGSPFTSKRFGSTLNGTSSSSSNRGFNMRRNLADGKSGFGSSVMKSPQMSSFSKFQSSPFGTPNRGTAVLTGSRFTPRGDARMPGFNEKPFKAGHFHKGSVILEGDDDDYEEIEDEEDSLLNENNNINYDDDTVQDHSKSK